MPPKRRIFIKLYLSHVAKGDVRMQPCPGDESIFQEVVASMAAHAENSRVDLQRWMRDFSLISDAHQRVLKSSMGETFDGVASAIVVNQVRDMCVYTCGRALVLGLECQVANPPPPALVGCNRLFG
jgi:hypothetical protein